MPWYWEMPVCWECSQCGTLSYGDRGVLRKSPPDSCAHCDSTSFTEIGSHSPPFSGALPARSHPVLRRYLSFYGWFIVFFGAGSITIRWTGWLDDVLSHTGMFAPLWWLYALLIPVGIGILRGYRVAWLIGTIAMLASIGAGATLLVQTGAWVLAFWTAIGITGIVLIFKTITVFTVPTTSD